MHRTIAALALLAAAGAAHAQCGVQLLGVPDLDQRRDTLPGNGGMYCVPTSATNLLAYIANNGFPPMMLQSSPQDWQSGENYPFVGQQIAAMGQRMSTHATDGTTGDDGLTGLSSVLWERGSGLFFATYIRGEIGPAGLRSHLAAGNLVNICYGRYEQMLPPGGPYPGGVYQRNGGHCVTLTGVFWDCFNGWRIRYRDPYSDNALQAQSAFTSVSTDLSPQSFAVYPSLLDEQTRWRLTDLGVGDTTKRCIDGRYVIQPLMALTASPVFGHELVINRPFRLPGSSAPPTLNLAIPDGGIVTGVSLHPEALDAIVTSRFAGTSIQNRTWRLHLPTGEFTHLFTCTTDSPAVTSRFGDVYVPCGGTLRRYEMLEDGGIEPIGEVALGHSLQALAFDDARDEIVGLSRTGGRLIRFSLDLSTVIDEPLPEGVELLGEVSLAVDDANQRYFLAGSGGPVVYELGLLPAVQRLEIVNQTALPAVQSPAAMQFNDLGHLVVAHGGGLAEFARGVDGAWTPVADSLLAGLAGGRALAVGRSRSDFIAGVHDAPEWNNIIPDENTAERPECRADWNTSGTVNSTDISAFLTSWLGSIQVGELAADFNADLAVNSTDISAFLSAWLIDVTEGCW